MALARATLLPFAAIAAVLFSCSTTEDAPAGPGDQLVLSPTIDKSPDPNVVEIDLEAREAEKAYGSAPPTRVWTYNGTVPGAFIDAKIGDRLVVHFKSSLPEPTTIHWHGVRVPATMDGSLVMQRPIPPGGTFEYSFTLKDAGLFWFHPHMRSDIQVEKGLHGVIRVRSADEPASDLERVLVLDDIRLAADGTITEYLDDTAKMLGREGNTILVNGVREPRLDVKPGALVRLRLVNVANGRFFNLRLGGQRLRVIGTDGGLVPKPYDVDTLLISPGERYDVMFVAPATPTTIAVTTEPYDRGHGSGEAPARPVMTLAVSGEAIDGRALPDAFPEIERLPSASGDLGVELDEKIEGENVTFLVNGSSYPNVAPLKASRGEVRALSVVNKTEMDHPFHLHGFFFQELSRNDVAVPRDRLANKDTIIVRAKATLRLVSRLDEPGKWMYHCHILEHAEAGMMGELHVE